MIMRASELKPGHVIRVELGDYDNWQRFFVEGVRPAKNNIVADVHYQMQDSVKTNISFRPDETVEVIADETA